METPKNYMKNRPGRRRVIIEIPQSLFHEIKAIIEARESTITKYILGSIVQRIRRELVEKNEKQITP